MCDWTGGDGGSIKAKPGRLDEPDLQHVALMLDYILPPL
jgi:hypothetical protein